MDPMPIVLLKLI